MRTLAIVTILVLALSLIAGFAPRRQLSEKDRPVAGRLWLDPLVPRVGEPLGIRTVLFNLEGLPSLPLPYESPRAGDTVIGLLQPTGRAGEYAARLTYTQPGRRWINIYLEGPEGRLVLETGFWVFTSDEVPEGPVPESLAVVVRPEPGQEAGLSPWLEPVTYAAIIAVIGVELAIIAWSLLVVRR
ncbi:MAG: hypothetical protein CL878_00115, partial [Dehalococcoidia bacterium]|nr:hypothetical protein [Dehalococcoidia bacterium]